jgi:hypothetical protein
MPTPRLNKFGLREKSRYRTADVCAVLGISSDLLRWRFLTGKYSEVRRDGRGRIFTVGDLEAILAQTKHLGKGSANEEVLPSSTVGGQPL